MNKTMILSTLVIAIGLAMFSCSKEEISKAHAMDATTVSVHNPAARLSPVVLAAGYTQTDLDDALQPFKAALIPLSNYISLSKNPSSLDLTISQSNYALGEGPTNVVARVLYNGSLWGAALHLTFIHQILPSFPCTGDLTLCQMPDGSWQLEDGCP